MSEDTQAPAHTPANAPDIGAFGRSLGFRVSEWEDGRAKVEMDLKPEHLNRSGVLHGGVICAILDTACGYAGTFCTKPGNVRWALTLNLNTNFTGQAKGGTITAVATKKGGGRKIYFATAELFNEDGEVIGFGDAVMRYRSGSEDAEGMAYSPPG